MNANQPAAAFSRAVHRIATMLGAWRFERSYGAFGLHVRSNGNAAVQRSADPDAQLPPAAGVEELRAEAHLKETQENKAWPRQAKPCIAAAPHLSCR